MIFTKKIAICPELEPKNVENVEKFFYEIQVLGLASWSCLKIKRAAFSTDALHLKRYISSANLKKAAM